MAKLGSIHDAAANGDLATVRRIVEQAPWRVNQDDSAEWRPIFHAGLRRHYSVVKFLLDHGADLAAHDGYVMHYAGEVPDNKAVVALLVAYGGLDAHAKPSSELARQFICSVFLANARRVTAMLRDSPLLVQERYARGDTALHHAARNGDLEVVTLGRCRGRRQRDIGSWPLSPVLRGRSWTRGYDPLPG